MKAKILHDLTSEWVYDYVFHFMPQPGIVLIDGLKRFRVTAVEYDLVADLLYVYVKRV